VLRYLVYLLASIFVATLLRAIIGIVTKGFGQFIEEATGEKKTVQQPPDVEPIKCPICGTYAFPKEGLRKSIQGHTVYFCSAV
jgi:hypothetical protein